jgi:hypothetical protein
MNTLASASDGNPVIGGVIVLAFAVVVFVWWARDRARAPFVPCRSCRGRGVRSGVRGDAFGPCPRCKGKPSRRRW